MACKGIYAGTMSHRDLKDNNKYLELHPEARWNTILIKSKRRRAASNAKEGTENTRKWNIARRQDSQHGSGRPFGVQEYNSSVMVKIPFSDRCCLNRKKCNCEQGRLKCIVKTHLLMAEMPL